MKKLVMALVPVLMFGCGGDPEDKNGDGIADGVQTPNNVSVVVPATPKGTISGQVLTTQEKPLAGATVSLTIGSTVTSKTATTDDTGSFAFTEVPAGAQVLLTFAKEGFASLRASSIVPDSAGNVPINNGNASFGPVLLSELNGQMKITVVGPTGRPAEGARGTLEVDPAGRVLFGLSEQTSSKVVVEAVADANGLLTFDKIPTPVEANRISATYRLSVAPLDTNGDGVFETGGLVKPYEAADLITQGTVKVESLPYGYNPPAGQLAIDHSNVEWLKFGSPQPLFNMIKPGENIYVVFNQPVQPNSVLVGLTDEYGKESLSIAKNLTGGGTVLTLTPGAGTVQAGKEYNLYLRAVAVNGASSGQTTYSNTVAFFGGEPSAPPAISVESVKFQEVSANNGLIDSGETVYVNFNQVMAAHLYIFAPTYAYVYVGADLNNSGKIGDAPGERDPSTGKTQSQTSGFALFAAEPTAPIATKNPPEKSIFPLTTSGYTTRFKFVYSPPVIPATGATTPFNPTSNIPVYIVFSPLNPTTDVYESGWGVAQTTDIQIAGNTVTPIAVPVNVP